MQTVGIGQVLKRAIACEKQCGKLYRHLAQDFAAEPWLKRFWRSMQDDERRHARLLDEIRHSVPKAVLKSAAAETTLACLTETERFLESHVDAQVETLDDACRFAHRLEDHEMLSTFAVLAHPAVPPHLREALLRAVVDQHIGKLDRFNENVGGQASRIAARHA